MDYRRELAELRRRRDERTAEAHAEFEIAFAELTRRRDEEIKRLRAQGLPFKSIAPLVGCSRGLAFEVAEPDRRERYNARRRKHARRARA